MKGHEMFTSTRAGNLLSMQPIKPLAGAATPQERGNDRDLDSGQSPTQL
jgi:hypothetical protein